MRTIYTFLFWSSFSFLFAQSSIITPQLISSSGGTVTQDNYNLCFSLGEIAIETFVQGESVLTQGFHQENYQISMISEVPENAIINIYPNPAKDIIYIDGNTEKTLGLKIKDMNGRELFSSLETSGLENQTIDLSHFSSGIYFLEIYFKTNNKQVYKIQKFN